ncbi:MAG: phage tail tape measure protein [Defluviitaleaceae bacterium]|nr:phage tail tape measure protein [Defluviitaleaceae bacterium]
MSPQVTVIDITTQVTDNTAQGAASATRNVSRLEETMNRVQQSAERMRNMSRIELTAHLMDNASRGINNIFNLGRRLSGTVWRVTLKAADFITAPLRGVMNLLRNPIFQMAGLVGVGLGTADMIRTFTGFEQALADIEAIPSALANDMYRLQGAFRAMAGDFSATEIAAAAKNFVSINSTVDEVLAKTNQAKILSAASGMALYSTTYYLNNIMNKLDGDSALVVQAVDSMAMASTLAHQPLSNLMSSWNYMGSTVRNANMSMNEANALLVVLSDNGYRGSQAGTSFSAMMQNLMTPASVAAANALYELGFSMFDAYGEVRPFETAMRDLSYRLDRLPTQYDRVNKLNAIFSVNGARAADVVLNSVDALGDYIVALEGAEGAAQRMADVRMDTLQGSFNRLRSSVQNFQLSIMDRLAPHFTGFINWITDRMPVAERAVGDFLDSAISKGQDLIRTVQGIMSSDAFQDAGFFGRIGILWDEVIWQPFTEWWDGRGRGKMANVAQSIGEGLGSAISWGIGAIFGMNTDGLSGAVDDGRNIGRSFAQGFSAGMSGVDWSEVADGLKSALWGAIRMVFSNPVTGTLAALWLGGKGLGLASGAIGAVKGVGGIATTLGSTGLFGAIATGLGIKKAAGVVGAGAATQSALAMAQAGTLGWGTKIGAGGMGSMLLGAAGLAGGLYGGVTAFRGGADIIRSFNAEDAAEAAALRESGAMRVGGALGGAAVGAAIGSFIPVVGTLVGAGIGAGVGALIGNRAGNNRMESHTQEVAEQEAEMRRLLIAQDQARFGSERMRQAVHDLHNDIITAERFNAYFHDEITRNLQQRFGSIRLSMREIQGIAENIVFAGMQDRAYSFADAMSRAENSMSQLRRTANDLNRMNWMASTGTGVNREQYQAGVEALLSGAQNFLMDRQFEIVAATQLLLGDPDMSGLQSVFYQIQYEIDGFGERLREQLAYEGELNADYIAQLQQQIMDATQRVTAAQIDSEFAALGIRFGGGMLDESSFNRLKTELERVAEGQRDLLTQAFVTASQGARLAGDANMVSQLEEAFIRDLAGVDQRVSDFLSEQIGEKFGLSAERLTAGMQASIQHGFSPMTWTFQQAHDFLGISSLEAEAAGALARMINSLAATAPSLWGGVENAAAQSAWASRWDTSTMQFISAQGSAPVNLDNWTYYARNIAPTLQENFIGPMPFDGSLNHNNWLGPRHADGGILTRPHIGMVAEAGAEAIIPLSPGRRNRGVALWKQAGEMMGMSPSAPMSAGGNPLVHAEINPTIEVHVDGGGATEDGIKQVLSNIMPWLTDEMSGCLAQALQKVYGNMPIEAGHSPA